ncbi:hypothetical protein EUA60_00520 [TM7 phylum sp. oral taxon 346]|nr:hypothetical protein EUA60_00520 [TM7 phylum sp. oral taxon 346]
MSPENSNLKLEGARPLSRQERIEQLRQNKQQLELIIEQGDAVYKYLRGVDYDISVGMFVGPDGAVWGIKNRYGGMVSGDWLVVRCVSNESDENRPKIKVEEQGISKVGKTERERYPFLPTGIEAVDTLHLADVSVNIFWKKDKDKDKDSKGKGSVVAVADNRGIEFLPLDELIAKKNDTDNERPEEITADNNDDDTDERFEEITGPLEKEGLGAAAEEDLGATAVSTMVRVAA